jgi:hypothetical protein
MLSSELASRLVIEATKAAAAGHLSRKATSGFGVSGRGRERATSSLQSTSSLGYNPL